MKKQKLLIQSPSINNTQKPSNPINNKKLKKDILLLYRQRDESVQENKIESILYVKSNMCNSNKDSSKMKVQKQFKKIMNDLNAHLSQQKNQKNHPQHAKNFIDNLQIPSNKKDLISIKKQQKQVISISKKNKNTQRDQNKTFKSSNKQNKLLQRQKGSNTAQTFKSPKKNNKFFLSSDNKKLLSPKSPQNKHLNLQKQVKNIFTKNQQKQKTKGSVQKTRRKNKNGCEQNDKRQKTKHVLCSFQNSKQYFQTKNSRQKYESNIKKSISPLIIDQYILIEDKFQLVQKKTLEKLQTKLLSTYRNQIHQSTYRKNFHELENKLQFKHNQVLFEPIGQEFEIKCQTQQNNIQPLQQILNKSNSKEQGLIQFLEGLDDNPFPKGRQERQRKQQRIALKYGILYKIKLIQRWWRTYLTSQVERQPIIQNQQTKAKEQQYNKLQKLPQHFLTNELDFPSVQSLQFIQSHTQIKYNIQAKQQSKKDQQIEQNPQNEDVEMILKQKYIIRQKKQTHQKILLNLLKQQKLSQQMYSKKVKQIQNHYQSQLNDIVQLTDLIQNKNQSLTLFESRITKQNQFQNQGINFIQDGKHIHSDLQNDHIRNIKNDCQFIKSNNKISTQNNQKSQDNQDNEDESEIDLKIYKIGDRITSNMQQFIKQRKNKQNSQQKGTTICLQSEYKKITVQNYAKKFNQMGQQYFQDLEQTCSNDNSPHKLFQFHNIQQMARNSNTILEGQSFQPNTHFIQMLQEFKEQEQMKSQIQKRIASQMGAYKDQSRKITVDTSIIGIHQFLVNFFKFYLYYYKEQFLRFINMPYGYQPEKRLKFMQGYQDQSDELSEDPDGIIYGLQYIISEDVFDQFIDQFYGSSFQAASNEQRNTIQYAKIHDRALFDCFNDALNNFRPYYSINGPPYIWNCSQKALTFYFIAQQNIQQVFQKTQYKVLKWASVLTGLMIDRKEQKTKQKTDEEQAQEQEQQDFSLQKITVQYQQKQHAVLLQNRDQRSSKQYKNQLSQSLVEWNNLQQQKTSLLFELSSVILQDLALELMQQFLIY